MPKHPEPEYLVKWREIASKPPKCCHTCDYYAEDGKCVFHYAEPPADFASTDGACNDWTDAIPF